MNSTRIAAVAVLALIMTAPALTQAAPRSASTHHRLQKERMHYPARSAYRYEYRPAYWTGTGNEAGVIADDLTGENPFGAPPRPWGYFGGPAWYSP